jgi:heavy metal translocating P-type ATPase|eukprot:COSAG06_NODE_3069_length_5895_cov_29.923223_2_plen_575_part_00
MALGLLLNEPVAAVVILIMLTGGEALEDYAMSRAESGIHELLEREPGSARRVCADGSLEEVQATDLVVGDAVMLRNGDTTPVDCTVEGQDGGTVVVQVDESVLTGESLPQKKDVGDTLLAGSINLSPQPLSVRVVKAHADSAMELFKQTLAAALEKKAKLERSSIQVASDFTPFTMALASAAYWYQRLKVGTAHPLVLWGRVLAVTMAATPCPAAIGVPIAFLSGMSISSRHGIAMKSGAALENLGKATVCVLDKTGTVTFGTPRMTRLKYLDGAKTTQALEEDEVLRVCASLEQASNHPLAVAVIAKAREKGLVLRGLGDITVTETKAGHGVSGVVDGWEVRIGTAEYALGEGDASAAAESDTGAGLDVRPVAQLFAYFSIEGFGGSVKGSIACEDEIRPGAQQMVQTFKGRGLRCVMLSGDRTASLERIATHLGIGEYHTCLPHEKAGKVQEMIASGETVIMVGDGINDAPALATASVGVSIGVSDLASESADVVLLATADPITKLTQLVELGKTVHGVAKRGVVGGMAISTLQMLAAACGFITPRTSAVLQECVDLGSLVHSLQLLFHKVI